MLHSLECLQSVVGLPSLVTTRVAHSYCTLHMPWNGREKAAMAPSCNRQSEAARHACQLDLCVSEALEGSNAESMTAAQIADAASNHAAACGLLGVVCMRVTG